MPEALRVPKVTKTLEAGPSKAMKTAEKKG